MIKDGEKRIRVKGRERYSALIDEWQATIEGSRIRRGKLGNVVRSFLIHNGVLLPNTEFGHLEVGGKEAEHRAASSVKERKEWSYRRWTKEVTKVLVAVENAIWPDLFIAGGGISRKADKWIPLLKNRTRRLVRAIARCGTSDATS